MHKSTLNNLLSKIFGVAVWNVILRVKYSCIIWQIFHISHPLQAATIISRLTFSTFNKHNEVYSMNQSYSFLLLLLFPHAYLIRNLCKLLISFSVYSWPGFIYLSSIFFDFFFLHIVRRTYIFCKCFMHKKLLMRSEECRLHSKRIQWTIWRLIFPSAKY